MVSKALEPEPLRVRVQIRRVQASVLLSKTVLVAFETCMHEAARSDLKILNVSARAPVVVVMWVKDSHM